jgi:hypothetical protein
MDAEGQIHKARALSRTPSPEPKKTPEGLNVTITQTYAPTDIRTRGFVIQDPKGNLIRIDGREMSFPIWTE